MFRIWQHAKSIKKKYNQIYMRFLLWILLMIPLSMLSAQVKVEIEVKDYTQDTLVIGHYYADRQLVKDSLVVNKGKFVLEADSLFEPGVYIALTVPDNQFVQFLMPTEDQEFKIKMDYNDMSDLEIKGSDDNELFIEYLQFLKDHRPESESLRAKIAEAEKAGTKDEAAEKKLEALDKKVFDYQEKVVADNPGTLTAMLIKANFDVDIPEYEGTEEEISQKRFKYFRKNYFIHLDTNNVALIRTPFLHQRIDYYVNKLHSPLPDSVVIGIDNVLDMLSDNPDAYRFYTSHFLNRYARMTHVGDDQVFVHMVDNYYSKGKAPWVDEETLEKLEDNAYKLKPLLIGKTLPKFDLQAPDSTKVSIHDIESEYTVLMFWKPSCGHCTKAMPHVVKFNDEYKDKGVTTISICTSGAKKYEKCWDVLKEKDMLRMINAGDPYVRFQQKVFVQKTPKIVILDKDKKVVVKDIPADKLSEIIDNIIAMDQEKNNK